MTGRIATGPIPASLTEQARAMAEVFYASWATQYPDATVVIAKNTIDATTGKMRGDFGRAGICSIADAAGIAGAATSLSTEHVNGWVNSQIQTTPPVTGRGDKASHAGFTALILDLDTRRKDDADDKPTGHKVIDKGDLTLPTLGDASAVVEEVCAELVGVEPTAVVQTSDEGVHVWWKLDRLVPSDDPLIERWKGMWEAAFAARGFHIDLTVIADVSRVLRLPGQWRVKPNGRNSGHWSKKRLEAATAAEIEAAAQYPLMTVPQQAKLVRWNPELSVDPEALAERLPELPPRKAKKTTQSTHKPAERAEYTPSDTESTLDADVPPMALLDLFLDGELETGDGYGDGDQWRWGNSSSPNSATQHIEATEALVFVHSETMLGDLDIHPAHGTARKLTSTSLIRSVLVDDRDVARRLIEHLAAHSAPVEWLTALDIEPYAAGEDLAAWKASNRVTIARALAPVAEVGVTAEPVEPSPLTLSIEHLDGQSYDIEPTQYRLVIGGKNRGMYQRQWTKTEDGVSVEEKPRKLTDLVAIRIASTTTYRPANGREVEDLFDIVVIGPGGKRTLTGVELDRSLDLKWLAARANVGGVIPTNTTDLAHARNVLANAALDDLRRHVTYGQSGWDDAMGTIRYVQPTCSVTADGLDFDIHKSSGPQSRFGFTRLATAEEIAAYATEALPEYAAIFAGPKGESTLGGQLGVLYAAPLRLSNGCVSYLHGKHNSGKTRLAHPLLAHVSPSAPSPHIDLKKASRAGFMQYTTPHQSSWVMADDLKVTEGTDARLIAERKTLLTDFVSTAYDGSGNLRGTPTGDAVASMGHLYVCGHATGEMGIDDASMTTKSLQLPTLHEGDIDWAKHPATMPDGTVRELTRVDAWVARWGTIANAVYASYCLWLVKRAERLGGIAEMTTRHDRERTSLVTDLPASRATENVALALYGWRVFTEFLTDFDTTPGVSFEAGIRALIEVNAVASEEKSIESRIVAAITKLLTEHRGFITDGEGAPSQHEYACGWTRRGDTWTSSGPALGVLSPCGTYVRISSSQAQAAVPGLDREQCRDALIKLVEHDMRAAHKPTGTGDPNPRLTEVWGDKRPRGFTVPASLFGIER